MAATVWATERRTSQLKVKKKVLLSLQRVQRDIHEIPLYIYTGSETSRSKQKQKGLIGTSVIQIESLRASETSDLIVRKNKIKGTKKSEIMMLWRQNHENDSAACWRLWFRLYRNKFKVVLQRLNCCLNVEQIICEHELTTETAPLTFCLSQNVTVNQ